MLNFKYLGTRSKFSGLDAFPAPDGCDLVQLHCNEVTALCPVTGQPDYYEVFIEYAPDKKCLETKSLKLYLETFRDKGIFAEALAPTIRCAIQEAAEPLFVTVKVQQNLRGGIQITTRSEDDF